MNEKLTDEQVSAELLRLVIKYLIDHVGIDAVMALIEKASKKRGGNHGS